MMGNNNDAGRKTGAHIAGLVLYASQYRARRRRVTAQPSNPTPSNRADAGSGTGLEPGTGGGGGKVAGSPFTV